MTSQGRQDDIKNSYNDVIMTLQDEIFAGAQAQTVLLGFLGIFILNIILLARCALLIFYTMSLHHISDENLL